VLRAATTIGGGRVVDPAPPRHRSVERLELLERGDVAATIEAPVRLASLRHVLDGEPEGVERAGEWAFSRRWLDGLRDDVHARLAVADPLDPGVDAPAEPWAADVVPLLGVERRGSRLYLPGVEGVAGEEASELLAALEVAGFEPFKVDDARLARYLEERGSLVRLGDGRAVGRAAYDHARRVLVEECERAGRITLARFRDLLGVSRRPAQLLLERFDADGLTRRIGDERVLRRVTRTRT
jgi:selenocysteine-specific elongation factor